MFAKKFLIFVSLSILFINILGLVFKPYDFRDKFKKDIMPYKEAIRLSDDAFMTRGKTKIFLKEIVKLYEKSINYSVVSRVILPNKNEYILDPSLGIFFDFGFPITKDRYQKIDKEYKNTKYPYFSNSYLNNTFKLDVKYTHFRYKLNIFAKIAYYLKWIIPVIALLFLFFYGTLIKKK